MTLSAANTWDGRSRFVAQSLRRRIADAGATLTASAYDQPENALQAIAERLAAGVGDCAERLARLRGGEL